MPCRFLREFSYVGIKDCKLFFADRVINKDVPKFFYVRREEMHFTFVYSYNDFYEF